MFVYVCGARVRACERARVRVSRTLFECWHEPNSVFERSLRRRLFAWLQIETTSLEVLLHFHEEDSPALPCRPFFLFFFKLLAASFAADFDVALRWILAPFLPTGFGRGEGRGGLGEGGVGSGEGKGAQPL